MARKAKEKLRTANQCQRLVASNHLILLLTLLIILTMKTTKEINNPSITLPLNIFYHLPINKTTPSHPQKSSHRYTITYNSISNNFIDQKTQVHYNSNSQLLPFSCSPQTNISHQNFHILLLITLLFSYSHNNSFFLP